MLVGEPGTAGGEPIMKLPGHWTPKIGAVIQLGEPNRDAIVYDLHYRLEPEALSVFVYVHDPIERVYDPELAGSSG